MTRITLSTVLLFAILLLEHCFAAGSIAAYTAINIIASVVYLWFAREISLARISRSGFFVIAAAAVLLRASYLFSPPVGSDDVYRYVWDGKVQSAGLNPYQYAPDAPELKHLHSTQLPALVNHPDMKSLYFPFSEWIFLLGYEISGEEIWGYKLLLLLAEIASIVGIALLTEQAGLPRKFALLYALCPLGVMTFAVDAHLDGFGLPLMVFGLLFYLRGKTPVALLLLALSASVKPVALVFLPLLFLRERGIWHRARILLVPASVLILQFLPYLATGRPFEPLTIFAQNWTFNGGVFELVSLFVADNQKTRYVCALLLTVLILLVSFSRRDFLDKITLAVFTLLLLSPVVHPWYATWLACLIPVARRWSALALVSAVSLSLFTVLTYRSTGVWIQYPIVLILEYLPVVALLSLELTGVVQLLPVQSEASRKDEAHTGSRDSLPPR